MIDYRTRMARKIPALVMYDKPTPKGPKTKSREPLEHRHHNVQRWDCCCYNGCDACHVNAQCLDCGVQLDHNPNTTRRAKAETALGW